ncbi:hypothetical protein I5677_06720 [Mobilitalea sibirica]|uniref:Uncharacterized protein n=1 Tax=Mobilitalea sibirica TaxID=1462919 RepID=A0A8J7H698_9FIRM|nr:hypothetical protein [Mobilitalea sibirica]MBH1940576.1 hypothetical protein [Mobilitalea sibirica]
MKKSIWFIVIGILLMVVDYQIPFGKVYSDMPLTKELGEELQLRVINNFIGSRPMIDVIPDLLGYLFIFIGCFLLVKGSKRFITAMLLIPVAVVLHIVIPQLPYHFQLEDLYLKAAGYNFLIVIIEILIEFNVIRGIVKMTNCLQNKWHNNELLAGWILAMMSKGVLIFIHFFYGRDTFYMIYSVVLIGATVYYINRLFRTLEFNPEEAR